VELFGVFSSTASGTLQMQWRKDTADAETITRLSHSWIEIERIG
jgi:hypothetical protein